MHDSLPEDYKPFFEIGLVNEDPAVLVLDDFELCPTTLAALVTALFETVMRTVPDDSQIEYERVFNDALKILMKERFNYDVVVRYQEDE